MRLFISTSDLFGDIVGANVARQIKALDPYAEIAGVGGPIMSAEGVEIVVDSTDLSIIGFSSVLKGSQVKRGILGRFWELAQLIEKIRSAVERHKPDAIIFITSPALNLPLAQMLVIHPAKKIYFLPPETWAWEGILGGMHRRGKVLLNSDLVLTGFEFEKHLYGRVAQMLGGHGEVDWVGHPVADCPVRESIPQAKRTIGIFPGSRFEEVRSLLNVMLDAARRIHASDSATTFVLPIAGPHLHDEVFEQLRILPASFPIDVMEMHASEGIKGMFPVYEAMARCSIGIVASGTVALELMSHGVPSIVCYKVPHFEPLLVKLGLVKIKTRYISLPNVLAREELCPELLQDDVTAENIVAHVQALLSNPERLGATRSRLLDQRSQLGERGTFYRVALKVLQAVQPTMQFATNHALTEFAALE